MKKSKFENQVLFFAFLAVLLGSASNAKSRWASVSGEQQSASGGSSSEETGGLRAAPLRAVAKHLHEQDLAAQETAVKHLAEYMDYYNERTRQLANDQTLADWAYSTNINDENAARKNKMSAQFASWQRQEWKANLTTFDLKILNAPGNERLKRLFQIIEVLGTPALDDAKYNELTGVITNMTSIYSSAKVCPYDNQDCDITKDKVWALQPELDEILTKSLKPTDYDLLAYVWEKWHAVSGKKVRQDFIKYVQLVNEAAMANRIPSIKSGADLYLHPYESATFPEEVAKLFEELRPFYQEMHAFVRHKLRGHYGADKVDEKGPIPAHLLGNMWAQSWGALFSIVSEFTPGCSFDESEAMKKHNYTVDGMFKRADDFFASLGLVSLDIGAPKFYQNSMLQKPTDGREVVCHASAWDMYASNALPGDFRIKMCTVVTFDDFVTVHHELGHIQYYMQYVNQPPLFREGANPGFHEAIGDTLALSVATPKHLKAVGLMDATSEVDKNTQLAFLLKLALDKIAFLPFGYIIDLYRWKVFDGTIKFTDLNAEWWKLREEYQGVKAPVPRSEEDFDPGAKYHVVDDVEYMRYFVAHILQFAFHQSMCEAAGQFNPQNPDERPLHECDVGGSVAAGKILGRLMQAGSSRHWKEVLYDMTGSHEMTVRPLLNYFKPLRDYLKDYIARNNIHVGWSNN